jgi:hypothetical protein
VIPDWYSSENWQNLTQLLSVGIVNFISVITQRPDSDEISIIITAHIQGHKTYIKIKHIA